MSPSPVVGPNEREDLLFQRSVTVPGSVGQALALQGAEPKLDLIEPRGVHGQKVPDHSAGVLSHPFERLGCRRRLEMVTDPVEDPLCTHGQHPVKIVEKFDPLHGPRLTITPAPHPARPHVQGRQPVERAMPDILEFLSGDMTRP